jgi:hypothetical protein
LNFKGLLVVVVVVQEYAGLPRNTNKSQQFEALKVGGVMVKSLLASGLRRYHFKRRDLKTLIASYRVLVVARPKDDSLMCVDVLAFWSL